MYSLSLSVATPSVVVFLNIRQLEFHRITILTRFVILILCFETVLFSCCLWWVIFLFFVASSCSVPKQRFQTNTVRWQMAIPTRRQQLFNIHRPFRMLFPRYLHGETHFKPIFESNRLRSLPKWTIWVDC